jgi:hypothetical protein
VARKLKCDEAKQLQLASIAALTGYAASVKNLRKLTDKDSAEFYSASQLAQAAREEYNLANWHFRHHREKHGC